ncbi:MerR family transcriptional regulator [Thermaerobacillus caldiproteolyticus]|uniref:DNA-binding transcriptional MerR regulator n=1 Tax=Thermaerobacillus caldiproteolyticus TaxID=247480 RepID=A0A7V9Z940_9BACL|nr:MerR family transcriptional regulator [Anoxybacillus caldiproteolyticus]MBA2876226.1 DNA-binding transcriptional MerR regulator [Anoxybacillus caldiproteolyticus]
MIRPIDIARKLNISTSALRHYESWGIVPPPERKPNGYRIYTEVHVAYFECIRAMYPGFGMDLIRKIMPLVQQNKITEALWLVNEVQANLYRERRRAEQALKALEMDDPNRLFLTRKKKDWFTIGEVAKEIDVPSTTLRHWEKEGLIMPERDKENGYRKYSPADVRKLLIIRTLRSAVYSLDTIREIINEFDSNNIAHARKIAKDSLSYMDYLIMEQLRGAYYLYKLCNKVNSKETKP